MTSEIRRAMLLGMTALLAGCGSGDDPGPAPVPSPEPTPDHRAQWTLMLYLNGCNAESGLEPSADGGWAPVSDGGVVSANIHEALQASVGGDVNIVLLTGGARKDGWRTLRRFVLRNQTQVELAPPDNPNASMDDAETLQEFMRWGASTYPAKQYGLLVLAHGGGALGGYGGGDQNHPGKGMNIKALQKTFAQASVDLHQPLDLLIWNSCLMSSYELAYSLRDTVRTMVASQETIPFAGLDFHAMASFLGRRSGTNAQDFGRRIVESYFQKHEPLGFTEMNTLAVTDLQRVAGAQSALEAVFAALHTKLQQQGLNAWKSIAAARAQALDFQTNIFNAVYSLDLMDIASFLRAPKFQALQLPSSVVQPALDAIDTLAIHKRWGDHLPSSCGLQMYFPSISLKGRGTINKYNSSVVPLPVITDFVNAYAQFAQGGGVPQITVEDPVPGAGGSVSSIASSTDFECAYAALTDASGVVIGVQDVRAQGNDLTLSEPHHWPSVNGKPVPMIATYSSDDQPESFLTPVLARNGNVQRGGFLRVQRTEAGSYLASHASWFQTTGDIDAEHFTAPFIQNVVVGTRLRFVGLNWSTDAGGTLTPDWDAQLFDMVVTGPLEFRVTEIDSAVLAGCSVRFYTNDYMGRISTSSSAYLI